MAERFAAIRGEYEAAAKKAEAEAEKGKTEAESRKIYFGLLPDEAAFSRRMVDLAATDPRDAAARDALLWVIDKPGMGPSGPYVDEFMRAVLLLLRHHADDPETARAGLGLDNLFSPARDLFLEGLYVRTQGHEAKGLARLALAGYLKAKAGLAAAIRYCQGAAPDEVTGPNSGRDGKPVEKEFDIPPEEQAYHFHLRMGDPGGDRRRGETALRGSDQGLRRRPPCHAQLQGAGGDPEATDADLERQAADARGSQPGRADPGPQEVAGRRGEGAARRDGQPRRRQAGPARSTAPAWTASP